MLAARERATGGRSSRAKPALTPALRCRRKFLRFFPGGFRDGTYVEWERGYKAAAHARWVELLDARTFRTLIKQEAFAEAARRAVAIESRTNLLFSFEKMALRDAVQLPEGARAFATGLYDFLHVSRGTQTAFEAWCEVLAALPRRQTRVLTWPLATVFGFLAQPERHIFLKPNVTRRAAAAYGADFRYVSRPNWNTYRSLLDFAEQVRRDQAPLHPLDMIDLQSFIWVQGSDEYE